MSEPASINPYDQLAYPSHAWSTSHPGHLAALGRLLGVPTADPNACRVLELGCSDGGNLIAMAVSLPGSEFVGVDLTESAIERGRQEAAAAGARNVLLMQGDIAEIGAELGEFDYVVAHGVYSWVPEQVRAAVLRVIRERMRPGGLAFVSYNALPGDQIRGVVRQMMRMHTSHITDARQKVQQARGLLSLLAQVPGDDGDTYRTLLQSQIGKALLSNDELLYHDDLAPVCQPFFFTEFMGVAGPAGLQFACEAVYSSMSTEAFPPNIAAILDDLGERSIIAREQYRDFFTCCGFRQTVLCHAEVDIERAFDPARLVTLRFFSSASREPETDGQVTFKQPDGTTLSTSDSLTVGAFESLMAAAPASLSFDEVAAAARADSPEDQDELALILFQAVGIGLVEVRVFEPQLVFEVSERPLASPWARLRSGRGTVVNLYHHSVDLDEVAQRVLPLTDGTRTVRDLAAETGLPVEDIERTLRFFAGKALLQG